MIRSIDRRAFLKRAGSTAVALATVPILTSRVGAAGDKLVVRDHG
jgi:hypothetical protein